MRYEFDQGADQVAHLFRLHIRVKVDADLVLVFEAKEDVDDIHRIDADAFDRRVHSDNGGLVWSLAAHDFEDVLDQLTAAQAHVNSEISIVRKARGPWQHS